MVSLLVIAYAEFCFHPWMGQLSPLSKLMEFLHEFSTIPGIREDVTDIILNLKQLCIKVEEDVQLPLEVHFDFQKDGVLTAADLAEQFPPEVRSIES